MSFEGWSSRLNLAIRDGDEPIADFAEVNVIRGNAVLRLRLGGKVTRTVLYGQDPLFVPADGRLFEILEYTAVFGDTPSNQGGTWRLKCDSCVAGISVFLRTTGEVDETQLRNAAVSLQAIAPSLHLTAHLRRDSWFVTHTHFPFLYAFDEGATLPTAAEYRASQEVFAYVPAMDDGIRKRRKR